MASPLAASGAALAAPFAGSAAKLKPARDKPTVINRVFNVTEIVGRMNIYLMYLMLKIQGIFIFN
jgi:hypothetical protein